MSNFNPGTGGTMQSTNLPAAFLELAFLVQAAEESNTSVDAPERMQITYDSNAKTATINLTMGIIRTTNSSGQVVETADPSYLSGAGFIGSTFTQPGGQLKSTTLPSAFLELAQIIVNAENAYALTDPALTTVQRTGLDIDANTQEVIITGSIPFTEDLAGGRPILTAVDYLP